ncbi:exosortase Y-associated Wzy-like protein [Mucilaginibacter sp. BT774]|uniref:exosortase Y-associated Wzy-like protein n=1 Tax=Mucilaginibacter sp. BT774 TaxID=3062276 RepID=UPI002675FCCA|nr:hypothetical protein [Mucilaginibacter sp. BT774]MDO3627486.1 hypothetical protein [Mucilaginibacter sp. BT774]
MKKNFSLENYLLLYIPWGLAMIFKSDPQLSYMIAWLGSFLIFYLTLSGAIRPLPRDLSLGEQLMRPILLVQIIFAGYMCLTTIFFYLDVLGYVDFQKTSDYYLVDNDLLQRTAECQRYYCLGHAAFVTGILMFMNYPDKNDHKYYIPSEKIANLLFITAIITLPLSYLFIKIPGLSQFANQFTALNFIAGTLALAFAIPKKKIWNTLICILLFLFNFYQGLVSGFKEPIIISIMVLGIFLYPYYKKLVLLTFIPAIILLFVVLPTYNRIFRENAWSGDLNTGDATELALNATLNKDEVPGSDDSNWSFLAYRLSEIDMFTRFVQSTPEKVDFYRADLLKQSAVAIVPRVFWPSKPITENMVMERVYAAGVVNRNSTVSAKPAYIVDAYLSYGGVGVFVFLLLYGIAAQWISVKAEKLFGGYILGTALIFSGLFQIMWRGLSFEFIINTMFWSYITMIIFQKILIAAHVLKPK